MDIHDRRADLSLGQIPRCVVWEERVLDVGGKVDYFRKNPVFWTALGSVYYVLSSIQFKYKILTNKIRLDCGTVLRSGRFLTHRHVSC